MGNLLDNACRYGASEVQVVVTQEPEDFRLQVIDNGPGIPIEKLDQLKHRGQRLDERIEGSGLGLAICDDIVQLYSGKLTLIPSASGMKVEVILPRVS